MNKKQIISIITGVFTILLIILVFLVYWPKTTIISTTFNKEFSYVENENSFTADQSSIQIDKISPNKIVNEDYFSNLNPLKSKYKVLFNYYEIDGLKRVRYAEVNLDRVNIFSTEWNILKVTEARIENKTFSEAIAIASKYDLSTTNPDPEHITVYTPPTPQEIQKNKKSREINENPEYQKEREECIEAARPTLDEQMGQDCIDLLDQKYGRE